MLALKLDHVNKGVPIAVSIPEDINASISNVDQLEHKTNKVSVSNTDEYFNNYQLY